MISADREEALNILTEMMPDVDLDLAERFVDCLMEAAMEEIGDQAQMCGIDSGPTDVMPPVGIGIS